ncbi:MAG: SMP-30/gluconolactonase/LRE family protein [Lachnospiraceae bacterium]|nr:SMP-30/gluconolactonase/LRE family protein [Lachnospiraceae bacterium]
MKKYQAQLFDKQKYVLSESPFYDARFKRYSWVDIINGELWTLQGGVKTHFTMGQPIGAAIPLPESDGFILAAKDGLYIYENDCERLLFPLDTVYKSYWRSNDAKTDPYGRIYFGATVVDDDHEPEGALFCYDQGKVFCLQENTKISNGMAWSSDRKSFFFSDSLEHGILKYDYNPENGIISNRRMLCSIENGVPDGMCIDKEDNLWVAVWGGNRIEKRNGETGELLAEIEVPAKQVSSCNFLDDGKTLFITSAGVGLDGEFDGCLFLCEVE